jgi:hypothetical protein
MLSATLTVLLGVSDSPAFALLTTYLSTYYFGIEEIGILLSQLFDHWLVPKVN